MLGMGAYNLQLVLEENANLKNEVAMLKVMMFKGVDACKQDGIDQHDSLFDLSATSRSALPEESVVSFNLTEPYRDRYYCDMV